MMFATMFKLTVPATALMLGLSGLASTASAATVAGYNLCNLHNAPSSVLKQVSQREDFGAILGQMMRDCPSSAMMITEAPTASISHRVYPGDRDDRHNRRDQAMRTAN